MAATLYRKQRQVLEYIKSYIQEHNGAPTLREIADNFRLSSLSTVHAHLSRLEQKGYIHRDPHQERSIQILNPKKEGPYFRDIIEVPLTAVLREGELEEIEADELESVAVPVDMIDNRNVFCVRVEEDVIDDSLLMRGDIVLVEEVDECQEGEVVLARLASGKVVVRKLSMGEAGTEMELEALSHKAKPDPVEGAAYRGRVLGVLRGLV